MGRVAFRLPDIGEGIAEAEIVAWHVKVGDQVEEDQPLADLMTDKATVEMSAPVSGRLVELAGQVGDTVAIGSTLALFETAEEAAPPVDAAPAVPATASALADGPEAPDAVPPADTAVEPVSGPAPAPVSVAPAAAAARSEHERKVLASPAVRQRARELGIDLAQVCPPSGRVRHADLDAFIRFQPGPAVPAATASRPAAAGSDEVEEIRVTGLRRRIAENMAEAKRRIPHFAYVEETDVTALETLRQAMTTRAAIVPS